MSALAMTLKAHGGSAPGLEPELASPVGHFADDLPRHPEFPPVE